MSTPLMEHINVTVKNPTQLAKLFCSLFDWKIRWSGESKDQGFSVHVGTDRQYFALYTHSSSSDHNHDFFRHGTLNHIGIIVDDLDAMELKVKEQGLKPDHHRDYGICKSFYFMAEETLEIEVVCYKS